jgi:acyl-coenzyme A thioesterase PaaI-like protein
MNLAEDVLRAFGTTGATFALRAFGLLKIPLLAYVRPQVIERSLDRYIVKIPLTRRTKNHLGSMYFGTLAVGADCAGGMLAQEHVRASGQKISLIFKDFKADFLKRPESDVHFTCNDGALIAEQVRQAVTTGQRQNRPVEIIATCPEKSGDTPVARFVLTLSLKKL